MNLSRLPLHSHLLASAVFIRSTVSPPLSFLAATNAADSGFAVVGSIASMARLPFSTISLSDSLVRLYCPSSIPFARRITTCLAFTFCLSTADASLVGKAACPFRVASAYVALPALAASFISATTLLITPFTSFFTSSITSFTPFIASLTLSLTPVTSSMAPLLAPFSAAAAIPSFISRLSSSSIIFAAAINPSFVLATFVPAAIALIAPSAALASLMVSGPSSMFPPSDAMLARALVIVLLLILSYEKKKSPSSAIDFLSCLGQYPLAERVLLDGIDDDQVAKSIRKAQLSEVSNFRKNDKNRVRMMIQKSRLLYGVCDPFQVLKEGQVHIRITTARKGPSTPLNCSVLVVRNPCLHPGDCLKLRAVECSPLSHLVDCIVFASVARPGHHAAPSMSSGGDLDGDKFFVCWDPDLVPAKVAESYDYPPNKEQTRREVSRLDLAKHFAAYNGVGLAKVASLHNKWVRASAKGAMSPECQELNALHSQSVDGARVKIPDRLLTPPEPEEPFVIEVLANAAAEFAIGFSESESSRTQLSTVDEVDARNIITGLLKSKQNALSEYELFNMVLRHSRKHSIDVYTCLSYLDMGALSASEKYAIMASLNPGPGRTRDTEAWMFNSLFRSDILTSRDLYQRNLSQPFSIQRFYSSKLSGMSTFFKYLHMATQDFTRKLLLLKTDDRFAIGVFMRGQIAWDEDPEVNENVVVCSFLPHGTSNMSTYRPCNPGYRLHCSDANLQLYNKHRGDTFIFMTKPPAASGAEIAVSIALQKISAPVQRQLGRLNRAPVIDIEIHVVSNRDRVAHQLFDLWFEHVPTEEHLKRFEREKTTYERNNLKQMNWEEHPWLRSFFQPGLSPADVEDLLPERSPIEIDLVMKTAISYHAEETLFFTFNSVIARKPIQEDFAVYWLDQCPPLAFSLLKAFPPHEASQEIHEDLTGLAIPILQCMVRSANDLRIAVLVGLEKLALTIARISLADYLDLLMLAALSIRAPQLLQEVLLVLHDSRPSEPLSLSHAQRHGLAVSFDRAEEAADECPCDDEGKPKRQRTPPTVVKLTATETYNHVKAAIRVDDRSSGVRLHSHVRLQAASHPDRGWVSPPIVDGIAIQSLKGELKIEVQQPLPPEATRMSWKMYNAGSIATAKAMMDALLRLATDGAESCLFHGHITGADVGGDETAPQAALAGTPIEGLNRSQSDAVHASDAPLSLIWGPPGTGKTTVVIRILEKLLQNVNNEAKILMTASTHNAVDNVLERFVVLNKKAHLLTEDQILRVATDQSKVNKSLQHYTIDARVGGDLNENNKLAKQALARVKSAVIVFTTCAGQYHSSGAMVNTYY
ncbi:hypothetical protein PTI98_004049 [Pleurotus ostreatus]|nr:hypothetical protein PTI98_004049 [Pleurotus ostreatus]